jgi:hypothetical protein
MVFQADTGIRVSLKVISGIAMSTKHVKLNHTVIHFLLEIYKNFRRNEKIPGYYRFILQVDIACSCQGKCIEYTQLKIRQGRNYRIKPMT